MPRLTRVFKGSILSWTTLRKAVQGLSLLAFLMLFIGAQGATIEGPTASLFLRLDPLGALANGLASKRIAAGTTLALITLALTFITGRAWCGWVCPLGTLLDLFSLRRWRKKGRQPPERFRKVKYILLLVTLFSALLGSLSLLILDPLTLLTRSLSAGVLPTLDRAVTTAENLLYRISFLRGGVSQFDRTIRPVLLPQAPLQYRTSMVYGALLFAVVFLNLFAERFWCRYLCPLGALLGVLSKVALLRRRVKPGCPDCKRCAIQCPTGTIQPEHGYLSDPGECTLCLDCLEICPTRGTAFTPSIGFTGWNSYDPDRRQALTAFGTAVAGVAFLRLGDRGDRRHPYWLLPPGAREGEFLGQCIRCAQCVRACPTGALQPAFTEAGLEGFWTPVLVPRLGYCDYACNACGRSCPVSAIPQLSLEQKRLQILGRVVIDEERCIAWAEDEACIVCEEMCPLPEKAIRLEEVETVGSDGGTIFLQRPHVEHERCIGCGICEYKCPVLGEAAIRVYALEAFEERPGAQFRAK